MRKQAFTLVEILIVVIILGILAAIVIPQFTEASDDARESALSSDLQTVRSQIELYKVQHSMYPGRVRNADGTFTDWSGATFVSQLTSTSDVNGDTDNSGYGPYLQEFPTNPFASGNGAAVAVGAAVEDDGDPGWFWDTDDFKFMPNDADHSDE